MSNPKLHQIVSLREMLKKWRRLALRKAHSFSDLSHRQRTDSAHHPRRSISMPSTRGNDGGSSRGGGRVPPGHLAVHVGEERKRFVIKMWYLSHPLFRALLKKTEEEIGFQQEGALALACEVAFFEQLLRIIQSCKAQHHNSITSLRHHRHSLAEEYPSAAEEQYQELLLQLLESADLAARYSSSTASHPLCNNLDHSFSRSFRVAVVA